MAERVLFYEEEALEQIRKIPNRDARRILRVIYNLCKRHKGVAELYLPREDEAVLSCFVEEPISFYSHEFHGAVKLGHLRIVTTKDVGEFMIPEDWDVEVAESEAGVYGFKVGVKYDRELGRWGVKVSPVKIKPAILFRRRAAPAVAKVA